MVQRALLHVDETVEREKEFVLQLLLLELRGHTASEPGMTTTADRTV